MADESGIEWTDSTFNPWIGCTRVSPGCVNCYAETLMADRYGRVVWGPQGERSRTSDGYWRKPIGWNRAAEQAGKRRRVFCASLADVFDDHPSIKPEWRSELWSLIEQTPWLDWQLLTKRPENVMDMVPESWRDGFPANVWLGTSVEDQKRADERIPVLITIPASVRFLSCEPLIGPLSLNLDGIHWVIVGGESGPVRRPMDLEWARSIRDQCLAAGVPFFFKQVGGRTPKAGGRVLDGRTWDEFPLQRARLQRPT